MGFVRQTWTLTEKNLLIVFSRHWLSTLIRAFLAPIVFMFFISYAKNFFVPPSTFGVGSPSPLRSLTNAIEASGGSRNTVAFINNGYTGGAIENVINQVADTARGTGANVQILSTDNELLNLCPSSLRGVTACYAAASFHSSPSEGAGGLWNYTIRADGALGTNIYVNRNNNDAEIYVLPLQHAIDATIATASGKTLTNNVQEYPFTTQSNLQRAQSITRLYMGSLISILAVAYFIGVVGVTYQLTGQMAAERELGMSQLIESMMPNIRRWQPQAARILSYHLSFDIIYLPGWVIMGGIVSVLTFPSANPGIIIVYHILAGLSLTSWSIGFASLFRKAQLSGITVVLVSIVLAIIVQVTHLTGTGTVVVLSLLFPPMNYTLFIIWMAYWQQHDQVADLAKVAPNAPWHVAGYVFWVFVIIQILLFPLIGAFIERALYGTASKTRKMHHDEVDSSRAVELSGFSKHYRPGWWNRNVVARLGGKAKDTVIAVNKLSLTVLKGQIVVLLGANGSGKSTTLDAIAGLSQSSEGTIDIDGTGGLGLCPQKNVLWDVLTVHEHVSIFNRLKTTTRKDTRAEIEALVRGCDMEPKMQAKAKTLSGGQKRKLQLAMMFTGGSRVCCVDEVSSGIDPLSRRKIWDILLAERGHRSILFTTHFLDEADLLSDHIAILSRGNLMAEGSAVELKHRLGGGYRVHIYHDVKFTPPRDFSAVPKQILYDQTVYQLTNSVEAARFVSRLEEEGVRDYRVNGPTIEDVFLRLAEEVKSELQPYSRRSAPVIFKSGSNDKEQSSVGVMDGASEPKLVEGPQLLPGESISILRQSWILFRKRFTILRRNTLPYCAALLLPIIAAGLVTLFVQGDTALSCSPEAHVGSQSISSFFSYIVHDVPVGPPSLVSASTLAALIPTVNATALHSVSTLSEFNTYVGQMYANVTPGGFFLDNNGASPVFAYIAEYDITPSVLMQNVLDSFLLRQQITTGYESFAVPWAPKAGQTLQLILYFGLAMCAYPGFFALYPTIERLRNVRALHYSNGVRAGPLWLAYLSFDFLIVLLGSIICIVIFATTSSAFYYPGYLFTVFFLFGLASILLSYVVSLFTPSQLAAFAIAAGGQCVFFLIYFIAFMSIITYSPAADIDRRVNIAHFTIALVSPSGSLLRALLLALNEFSLICQGASVASYPGDITVYGGPILYLIVQSALLLGFLVWWDSGWKPAFLIRRNVHRFEDSEEVEGVDPEVQAEVTRVADADDPLRVLNATKVFGSSVAVQDVTFGVQRGEVFALLGPNGAGKSTTIGLIRGDIRPTHGHGDVLVEDISIIARRAAARQHLGVCPQFDAMDSMTVLEHLRFYARVRGVRDVEHNVAEVIEAVGLQAFKYRMAAKLSGGNKRKLSLGIALMGNPSVLLLDEPSSGMDAASKRVMWRTLSSVTADRSLVLTTHSMEEADALAHRAGIMARKMLALGTSDSLRRKHGDAYHVHLVHRQAPHTSDDEMARIKQWVKSNIPGAVTEDRTFHGQLRFSVPNSAAATALSTIPHKAIEDGESSARSSATEISSSVDAKPAPQGGISALFARLEAHKEELGFEYYSVSQTTLDQVFLSIVGKHNVQEENYASQHQPKGGVWARTKKAWSELYHNA